MSLHIPFDNSYARLPAQLFASHAPTPVAAPSLVAFNHALAATLGLTGTDEEDTLAQVFSGSVIPPGAEPLAQLYAGHQFGHWNPNLGDGRAILLGEANGYDIQLKGAGRTPYSRSGDGRAWLGPVLREYVLSEAMHALGVPTTRALAVVETGEDVYRETALPGAVLTRVATSHIRVGTFQILAARQDITGLQALFEHTLTRHFPDATGPVDLLDAVIARQAELIAHWMSIGFIHGVMNTDNCAISGETIDYGPCALMDSYHPNTVFSSIDRQGRYAYANQPDIVVWNMAQLATALVPLMPDQDAAIKAFTRSIHAMPALIHHGWLRRFRAKIGLMTARDGDETLITGLLSLMARQGADFTNTFRALVNDSAGDQFVDRPAYEDWARPWRDRLEQEPGDPQATMRAANPALIARNHRVEQMIQAAVAGDYTPFTRLMTALATPYDAPGAFSDLARPPSEDERVQRTFCGT